MLHLDENCWLVVMEVCLCFLPPRTAKAETRTKFGRLRLAIHMPSTYSAGRVKPQLYTCTSFEDVFDVIPFTQPKNLPPSSQSAIHTGLVSKNSRIGMNVHPSN